MIAPPNGSTDKEFLPVSRFKTRSGEDREDTCFVDIEVFGKQAEAAGKYLAKGRPVYVEGRLRQDQWEDRGTGRKMSKLIVVAQQVQFLGRPDPAKTSSPDDPEQPAPPAIPPVNDTADSEIDDDIPF